MRQPWTAPLTPFDSGKPLQSNCKHFHEADGVPNRWALSQLSLRLSLSDPPDETNSHSS